MSQHILVGFSGGVDSAMTALLLRERGCFVHGAMMSVRGDDGLGCGRDGDAEVARALADAIGIPLTVFDCSSQYRTCVLDYFRSEYLAGRTPNPCVMCNPMVKFAELPRLAQEAGIRFDAFATGHYARIDCRDGRHVLRRGVDTTKDQSYFLYRLSQEQLAGTRFPLGELRKTEVRALAQEKGLPVHDKPDSQDFYVGEYTDIVGCEELPGDIVTLDGTVVGRHKGYWRFTPGQRKGLGVAYREPLYVLRVEPANNRVVVGTKQQERCRGCVATDLVFPGGPPAPGSTAMGRIRSAQPLRPMTIVASDRDRLEVAFNEPLQGVAPGQSLVLYEGDDVLGGGFIVAGV